MPKTVTITSTIKKVTRNKGPKGDPGDLTQPFDYVLLNSEGGTPPDQEAAFTWNATDKTLDINSGTTTLQVGQEVVIRGVNKTGVQIDNGDAVFISGAQGNRPTIELVDSTTATADSFIGLVTEDIADNAEGFVTITGKVRGLNTNSFLEGDTVWVDPSTPGSLTKTEPVTGRLLRVGVVMSQHLTQGEILVSTDIGHFTAEQNAALLALIA